MSETASKPLPAVQLGFKLEMSAGLPQTREKKGVVYTKPWVVELILDLAGYQTEADLVDAVAIEPAAGDGAFLVPMAKRLVASCKRQNRPVLDAAGSLVAYELDGSSAELTRRAVIRALIGNDVARPDAEELAQRWVRVGDYLFDAPIPPSRRFCYWESPIHSPRGHG